MILRTKRALVLMSLASFVFSVVLAEAGLRIAGVKFDASLFAADPIAGWRLRPGAEGWWVSEGRAYVRINSAGMHDREYVVPKPANVVRIAVLGDSMTAAVQVDVDRNFTRVLERELNGCGVFGPRTVEVMNFGVPGYGTAQELLTFRHRVRSYSPDGVILALYTYNDIQNNLRSLNPVDASSSPYFVLRDDRLILDESFRENTSGIYEIVRQALGNAANRSRVIQLVAEIVIRGGVFGLRKRQEAVEVASRFGQHADNLIYAAPTHAEMKEAWRVTEALILAMDREVRSHGMKFWLVTLSQTPQHLPPGVREQLVQEWGIADLFYPDNRLEGFARRHQINAIILAPYMAERAAHDPQSFDFGDKSVGHYTEHGHLAVGQAIGARLCSGL